MRIREGGLKGLALLAVTAAVCLGLAATARAQADARFTGTVIDAGGGFVAGATVTVKNERTGEERTVTSNAQGLYIVPNLKPSVYTIRAKFKDFAPLEYPGMQLVAAQELHLDL